MGDEEEPMDPKLVADEKCSKTMSCAKLYVEYETCASRIEKKGHGECGPYYMDYLGCIDKCVRFPGRPHMRPHHTCRRRSSRPAPTHLICWPCPPRRQRTRSSKLRSERGAEQRLVLSVWGGANAGRECCP